MSGLSEEEQGKRSPALPPGAEAAHEHIHRRDAGLSICWSFPGKIADCKMAWSEAGAFLQWAIRAQVVIKSKLMGRRR